VFDTIRSFPRDGGTIKALRDVRLRVPQKSIVGIVGELGCGKSTLAWST
jgi:ABC-type oligopeptide transport system ATPase subunit